MRGLTTAEERTLILSVGTHRKDRPLSPVEVARYLEKAIAAGATRQDCAHELQIGPSQVTVFLNLLRLTPEIQDLADWGNTSQSMIAFSSLAQLASLKSKDDQIVAAHAILAHRLKWKEVVQLVQLRNRSGSSIEGCVDTVVKLRPQIDMRHVFVGAISNAVKNRIAHLLQRDRDELMTRSLQSILKDPSRFTARLGTERFTIVGDSDPAQSLGLSADALERLINERLLEAQSGA
jgi:hypothetical protein